MGTTLIVCIHCKRNLSHTSATDTQVHTPRAGRSRSADCKHSAPKHQGPQGGVVAAAQTHCGRATQHGGRGASARGLARPAQAAMVRHGQATHLTGNAPP